MYSPVSKYSPEARKRMTYRAKGKSCGYYMRIVFFFSSLIQSLIIISLVLFLVYGKQQDSASVDRIQDMELRFTQLTLETMSLRLQSKNLTNLLNTTLMEKARNDFDLNRLRFSANVSYFLLDDLNKNLQQCNFEKRINRINIPPDTRTPIINPLTLGCNCGMEMETLKARMDLLRSNFTQTAMKMQLEMDQMAKDRDYLNLEVIQLRRDKSMHEKAIQYYQIKCKEEFVDSMSGITNVSKVFLKKIDSLFPSHLSFQLTCPKQKEHLEQIRTNCTNLSEEVVRKFQRYLDDLGDKVSMSQGNISILTAENWRMTRDYNWCSQNRTGLIKEHQQNVDRIQLKNDEEKEKMLKEKMKLKGEMEVMESSVRFKNTEIEHLKEQLKHLNMSCLPRTGGGLFPRTGIQTGFNTGSSNSGLAGGFGQLGRTNYGGSSTNSMGSSFGSNPSQGSSSSGLNKLGTGGLGSTNLGFGSAGSNTGLGNSGLNKQGSSNQGSSSFGSPFGSNSRDSSGTGLNKPGSTGLGSSSSFGSTFGSSNNPSSSGSSQNRFGGSSSSLGSNFGSSSSNQGSNFGSSSSNQGSSFGSSSSNQGSSFGSSNNNNQGSSFGSSNNNQGSSFGSSSTNQGSNFGSSSSNQGSNFGSSSSNQGSSSSSMGSSLGSSSSKASTNSRGSSSSFFGSSSSSSLGSSLGSSSSSQNKLSTTGKSSSSSSSSSSGTSTTASKSGFGWWGLGGGSSNTESKTGNNQGKGPSSSTGMFGSGRSNGPISLVQHLRDLEDIINPRGQDREKQELSRMLG